MHELGLCEAIVGAIEQRAKDRSVARVRVRVGTFHHVHPEAFEQSFSMAATGSVAEDAVAELVLIPARGRCGTCAAEFDSRDPLAVCPECGGIDVGFTGGDDLILESIEYRPQRSGHAGQPQRSGHAGQA